MAIMWNEYIIKHSNVSDNFKIHDIQESLFILKFVSSVMVLNQFTEFKPSFFGLIYSLSLQLSIVDSLQKLFSGLSQ